MFYGYLWVIPMRQLMPLTLDSVFLQSLDNSLICSHMVKDYIICAFCWEVLFIFIAINNIKVLLSLAFSLAYHHLLYLLKMKISCPWFISLRLQSIAESIKKGRSSKLSHSRTPSNASSTSAEVAELTAEAAPTSGELATSAASSVDSQLIDVPLERSEFLSLTSISLIWCLVVVRHFLIFWKWLYRLNGLKSIQYLFFISYTFSYMSNLLFDENCKFITFTKGVHCLLPYI